MCGIVGLYLKNPALEDRLGALFAPMLIEMTDRGPDSAGFAIYGDEVAEGHIKLTLQHANEKFLWTDLAARLRAVLGGEVDMVQNATAAVIKAQGTESDTRRVLEQQFPDVRIMSIGQSIEILKEMGLPQAVSDRFNLPGMKGSHIIGHTRMATESAVTTEGSHPFSTGMDLCLVHNGSLSNHNRLRSWLERHGIEFETDNDTEVAAGYLTWRLREGATLQEALESALRDLDGFYTFAIGTRDGFAVLRDPIACKQAVMAETDDYVAMATEYRSLAGLPGIENARIWEPEPGHVYSWGREAA
jgi:glutamate synthase domain-containing protein 1